MDKYLLLGYGISNKSVAKFFDNEKIKYDIYDDSLSNANINVAIYKMVVKSGSISNEHNIIVKCKENNIKVVSDLELFYLFSKSRKIIAITGTNGKSTTCTLLEKMTGFILAGNIGKPLFDYIYSDKPIIIEVSSYMSEYIDYFKANIYGFLNIYPNHLDHHHCYEEYKRCKFNLLKNVTDDDFVVYNYDNEDVCNYINSKNCIKVPFSIVNIDEGVIKVFGKKIIEITNISNSLINYLENVLLSVKIAMILDVDIDKIRNVLSSFNNLKHRVDLIFNYKGIAFYNDSKSTNLYAMKTACDMFKSKSNDKKVLLICGGKDSYIDYDVLNSIDVNKVLLNGENRDYLEKFFLSKEINVYKYKTLKEVLDNLYKHLQNINVVLFSPGFQSFDQFSNFEERGLFFENYLKSLYFSSEKGYNNEEVV